MRALKGKTPTALPDQRPQTEAAWELSLQALTPIYKGGANPKGIDEGRPFRGPAIRGQLRFWWRATSPLRDVNELREAERALFGGVFNDKPTASKVRVGVTRASSSSAVKPSNLEYVLWVSRAGEDPKPFHGAGANARLRVSCPAGHAEEIKKALQAWLLLGGIGSRSRRGLGAVWDYSHTLIPELSGATALRERVSALKPPGGGRDWPTLAGGKLLLGRPEKSAEKAWKAAVDAMQTMRMRSQNARPISGAPPTPSDLVADFPTIREGHGRLNSQRAALGLPIPFRWQANGGWQQAGMSPAGENRVPSPVLLRPIPVGSEYVPLMVVLTVPYPAGIQVSGKGRQTINGTLDRRGVDTFANAIASLPGWTLHPL